MSKYKKQVEEMLLAHKDVFDAFKPTHDAYMLDSKNMQGKFNEEGQRVMDVIRRYENMLCAKSESGKYGKFSSTLSEKFWQEVRLHFPKIDYIGVE